MVPRSALNVKKNVIETIYILIFIEFIHSGALFSVACSYNLTVDTLNEYHLWNEIIAMAHEWSNP